MAKTNITISDAAQRYIDDRINADHIATRAIALSITTSGAPRVYTGNITEKRIFIKRGENVDEAIAQAFSIEDEQDTNEPESIEEQEDIMETTTTTKNDKNTVEIRCITHRAWKDIQRLMDEAEQAIPEAHCRKRAEARGDTFMQEIEKRAKTRRIDPRGRDILYAHKTNLGSSRWYAYVVDDYDETGCTTFTDKSLCYESKWTHGREWYPISKCVCVYR